MDLYRIIAKNTIHRLTFVLVSILGPLCFCQDAIRNAANKYPADTVNFGFCGDANSFVRSLFQTSLAKTVLSSVLIEEIRILRQKLELEALPSDKVNLLQADFESLGNQVAEVFSGVIEFAVLGRSNGNHWVLEIELDRTNQDIDIIVESLQKKQRWLGFHYSPFDSSEWSRLDAKNEREDIYLAGELTSKGDQSIPGFTVFFMLDDRRLVVSSCPAVLSKAVKGELASLHSSGSLANKRQFLEVLMRASSGSICVPASLFVYVDPTEKYAQFLRQTEKAESESKTSIGFGELSAYGGTLALGVNGLDYEIQGYLSHTIPASPLFDLLSARGNTTPVFEGIPSDVDYYMSATLNPQALFALYSHLENDSYTNAEPLNRLLFGIVCQFPIFAFLSKAEISADCFSGQMDAYGYDYDEPISGSSFCTRLGLMPGNTVIEKFIVPISDATEKFSFDGVGYYRATDAVHLENVRRADQLRIMREKLVARNAFLETHGKEKVWFSIYSDEKDLERQISHVSRRQPELSEDESVRDFWNQLRDSGEPEIFVVFKGDQALNYLNRQFWWRSYQIHNWQANLLIEEESAGKGQKDKVTDPLEWKKNEFLSITYERWPSTLPKLLLSGAVGVYKTPKGLLIRYLQR